MVENRSFSCCFPDHSEKLIVKLGRRSRFRSEKLVLFGHFGIRGAGSILGMVENGPFSSCFTDQTEKLILFSKFV